MSSLDEYSRRVRGLLASLGGEPTPSKQQEVAHLIDHDEPAEGVRALAWIIVEEGKRVPRDVVAAIRELSAGLVDDASTSPDRAPRLRI